MARERESSRYIFPRYPFLPFFLFRLVFPHSPWKILFFVVVIFFFFPSLRSLSAPPTSSLTIPFFLSFRHGRRSNFSPCFFFLFFLIFFSSLPEKLHRGPQDNSSWPRLFPWSLLLLLFVSSCLFNVKEKEVCWRSLFFASLPRLRQWPRLHEFLSSSLFSSFFFFFSFEGKNSSSASSHFPTLETVGCFPSASEGLSGNASFLF